MCGFVLLLLLFICLLLNELLSALRKRLESQNFKKQTKESGDGIDSENQGRADADTSLCGIREVLTVSGTHLELRW